MEKPRELTETEERIKLLQESHDLLKLAQQKIVELSRDLATAGQTISNQADLIKKLSEDNLKLVAKLDALTGKKAPGKITEA